MQTSIFLARLLGPLLLLPGIGLFVNRAAFQTIAAEVVRSVTLIYLFGLMDFAAGLAIVLNHNVWIASWPVLITLIGWLLLVRGIVRVLIPQTLMGYAEKMFRGTLVYSISGAALIVLGLVLCYFGYLA